MFSFSLIFKELFKISNNHAYMYNKFFIKKLSLFHHQIIYLLVIKINYESESN